MDPWDHTTFGDDWLAAYILPHTHKGGPGEGDEGRRGERGRLGGEGRDGEPWVWGVKVGWVWWSLVTYSPTWTAALDISSNIDSIFRKYLSFFHSFCGQWFLLWATFSTNPMQ